MYVAADTLSRSRKLWRQQEAKTMMLTLAGDRGMGRPKTRKRWLNCPKAFSTVLLAQLSL